MFHFPGYAPNQSVARFGAVQYRTLFWYCDAPTKLCSGSVTSSSLDEFPHSEIHGSKLAWQLPVAYRSLTTSFIASCKSRHPPYTLTVDFLCRFDSRIRRENLHNHIIYFTLPSTYLETKDPIQYPVLKVALDSGIQLSKTNY